MGMDEKRAFTLVPLISASGELLPMQTIFFGQTEASCPNKRARCYAEAEKRGFKFEPSHSTTYWSTQAMMQSLVNDIIAPYFDKKKEELGLPSKQCSLWMIDCWLVHKFKEFSLNNYNLLHTGWMHLSLATSQCRNPMCNQAKHETISS